MNRQTRRTKAATKSTTSPPVAVRISNSIQDIIGINLRSVEAKDGLRVIELSSLDQLISNPQAEAIRKELLKNKVKVKQLTNHRTFEPWTKIKGFIEECMSIRYVSEEIMPIQAEMLIFNNTVAIYHTEPTISVTIIEHAAFAAQQKALFDNFWNIATSLSVNTQGGTTYGVTIKRPPQEVYDYIANLSNWPEFSDFAANFERVTDEEYIAHTSQGDIHVHAKFDPQRLLLDTVCVLPDGSSDFIPYRVVPNKDGAELMMTNFRPSSATRSEYEEQLYWMDTELKRAKEILEQHTNS